MGKRLLNTGVVIAFLVGIFMPAWINAVLFSETLQEECPAILTEAEKTRLADIFVEKVEYTYHYYWWFKGEDLGFAGNQRYDRDALEIVLYWKDGVYYFMPLVDCNAEVKCGVEYRKVRVDVANDLCVFHKLWQQGGLGREFGTWKLYGSLRLPLDRAAAYTYLGIVTIDVAGEKPPKLPPLERTEYIDAAIDVLREDGNQGELPEGRYKIYIGAYEYSEHATQVVMNGVIERLKLFDDSEYRWFQSTVVRNRDGSYDAKCSSVLGEAEKYPVMEVTADDTVEHIVEAKRLVVYMEVDPDDAGKTDDGQENAGKTDDGQKNAGEIEERRKDSAENGIVHRENRQTQITVERAQEWMEELYTYYQWFYVDMPYELERLLEEGETYHIYTDEDGNVFWIKGDGIDKRAGQDCYGGICWPDTQAEGAELPVCHASMGIYYKRQEELQKIGIMTWHRPELQKPELPALTEDGFILGARDYVQNELLPKGENSKYELVIGRYEILSDDMRIISAAVTGAEEYYLHCLVTRYADGTYGCFTAGGSYAGEWKSGSKRVERILELNRLKMPFAEENAEEINLYRDVLTTCERVWEEPEYFRTHYEQEVGLWEYQLVYGYAGGHSEHRLEYSFQDLNHDGTAELIVGIWCPQTDFFPEGHQIAMVCYDGEEGRSFLSTYRDHLSLYQGGVIEYQGGCVGCDIYYYYILDELMDSSGEYVRIQWEWDENKFLYQEKGQEEFEITREEFERIRHAYTGAGEVELTWRELKGFWRQWDEEGR